MSIFLQKSFVTMAAAAVLALGVQTGMAQVTSAERSAIRSACPADYEKHCASVPPGGEASLQCLQENLDSLDDACKTAVEAATKSEKSSD